MFEKLYVRKMKKVTITTTQGGFTFTLYICGEIHIYIYILPRF